MQRGPTPSASHACLASSVLLSPQSSCQRSMSKRRLGSPEFIAIGLDHTTAGIEVRERFAFADAEIPAALQQITDPTNPLLDQAAILSTCNRVELYGVARSRPTEPELACFLARYHGLDTSQVASMLRV